MKQFKGPKYQRGIICAAVIFQPPSGTYTQTIAITGTAAVNLRTLADNHSPGYNGTDDTDITYTLAGSVTITGSTTGGDAIINGNWPGAASHTRVLQITGTVRGGGGKGGNGGGFGGNGSTGGSGGDAFSTTEDIDITVNSGGLMEAAGGAGGGGGAGTTGGGEPIDTAGGGGGGGYPNGGGGSKGGGSGGSAGAAGTLGGGGAGGGGGTNAGAGGNGGNVNTAGLSGSSGNAGSGGGLGGRGFAIRKNAATVNVTNNGTITGTVG